MADLLKEFVEKWRCRACGKVWEKSELHSDPRRPNTLVCGDYFCEGTCDPVQPEKEDKNNGKS